KAAWAASTASLGRRLSVHLPAAGKSARQDPSWPRPNSRVTNRHLAAERATLDISPVGCLGRVRQDPANTRGRPRDSFKKTPSVKSGSCLASHRIRLNSGRLLPNGG